MSKQTLNARPLAPSDLDAWEALASRWGSLFDSVRWTNLFGSALRRVGIYDAGGGLRGGFCVNEQRRLGLRIWRNPAYTPQIGPFYEPRASNPAARTDEQRHVVEAMADYLSSSGAAVMSLGLSQGIADCLPYYWRGWKVVPRYTYLIDLAADESALLSAMSPEQRSLIRKSAREGVAVGVEAGTDELRALVAKTYARQGEDFAAEIMDRILDRYPPGEDSYCCLARQDGVAIAGVFVAHDRHTAYDLISGFDSRSGNSSAGVAVRWAAILHARQLGLRVYDFEGSVIPRIERFNRAFGGTLTPCFTVHKAWLPLEMGLKLISRYRNRF